MVAGVDLMLARGDPACRRAKSCPRLQAL